jgi:PKD repeat protein
MEGIYYNLRTMIFSIICFLSLSATAQYCCNANFIYSNTGGSSYQFIPEDTLSNYLTSWNWDFGNNTSSTSQYGSTTYQTPGDYRVTLTKRTITLDFNDSLISTCSITRTIHVDSIYNQPCNSEFSYVLNNKTALFYQSQSTTPYSYEVWSFGDGEVSYDPNPVHSYTYPGTYTVCHLRMQDSLLYNNWDSTASCQTCHDLVISDSLTTDSCNSSFTYSLSNHTISLTGSPLGANETSFWSLGDGTYSNDLNPVYTYASPGYYVITRFTIQQSDSLHNFFDSCSTQIGIYISPFVSDSCQAGFNVSIYGNEAYFTGYYSGNSVWSFGDGTYAFEQSPQHIYASAGSYLVTRTVLVYDSLQNFTDSCSSQQYIYISPVITDSCNAGFNFETYGNTVFFAAHDSSGYGFWDFGDNTSSSETNPIHTYSASGNYLVTRTFLSYDSAQYITDTCYSTQYVYIAPVITDSCNAGFNFETHGNIVLFEATGGNYGNWSFGDGSVSYEMHPLHYYSNAGTYLVTRTVFTYDSLQNTVDSCSSNQYVYIAPVIRDSCNAGFTFETSGNTVSFSGNNSNGYSIWNFGDNSFDYGQNPTHTYSSTGNFAVTQTVITYDSLQQIVDTCHSTQYVYIAPVTTDSCNADFSIETSGTTVSFIANDSEGYNIWNFGDNTFSTEKNPVHTYSSTGNYQVSRIVLTYDSSQHILDTCYSSQYIYVSTGNSDSCRAGFTYSFNSDTVTVRANNAGQLHEWTFGDGSSSIYSQSSTMRYVYQGNGQYTICHKIIANGDSCTECQEVTLEKPIVLPNPSSDVLTIQSNGGNLDFYNFYDSFGNTVAAQQNIQLNHASIYTANIPAGQYYLLVRYANGNYANYKIIIQH